VTPAVKILSHERS